MSNDIKNASCRDVSDGELVQRSQGGELAAFEELAFRDEEKVYSLAMRMLRHEQDAEDVTQQSFLNAMENLQNFRGDSSFSTWICRIAIHGALKLIRKRKNRSMVSLDETAGEEGDHGAIPHPEYIADWRESPEVLVHRNEIQRLLEDALSSLDEKHRMVFLLRDVEGFSVKETAESLGLTETNVKVRLLRARLQLREVLTRTLGDPDTRVVRHHEHAR